jgi:hypothetical protein
MVMLCISHIQRIGLQVDSPESFQHTWTVGMSELTATPDPAALHHCYFTQAQRFTPLADVNASYKRAKRAQDSSDHSFEFLFEATARYIRMKRDEGAAKSEPSRQPRQDRTWTLPKGKGHDHGRQTQGNARPIGRLFQP